MNHPMHEKKRGMEWVSRLLVTLLKKWPIRMLFVARRLASLIYFVSASGAARGSSLTVNMRIFQASPSRT